jgi:hypothetical protein
MAGQYNSYDLDRLSAVRWWEDIRNKKVDEDVPDPIEPHPFPDAVANMDTLLRTYWCYEAEGMMYSQEKAHDEFVRISNTDQVIEFVAYWARFAERAKEQYEAAKNPSSLFSPTKATELLRTGRCYSAVMTNMHIVKRYMAAYFSRTLNVKYSLAVLALEGVKAHFDSDGTLENNPFETIQTLLKPDLKLFTDLNKGLQLSLMSMAFAFGTSDTTVGTDPWVSFMAAIDTREVPRYVLLNQKVKEVEVSKKQDTNPWLILVIMALALYGLYYYNKNS